LYIFKCRFNFEFLHVNQCRTHLDAVHCTCTNPELGSCSGGAKLVLTVVSDQFQGKMPLARHRMINKLFEDELKDGNKIHALTIHAWTPAQWEKKKSDCN